VPNRIRQRRLELAKQHPQAFSAAAVARQLGVSDWTVRSWEMDRTRPNKRHAKALARLLGVSVEELGLANEP
jgi:DNA-binding transcriptional regulator YiaG